MKIGRIRPHVQPMRLDPPVKSEGQPEKRPDTKAATDLLPKEEKEAQEVKDTE